MDFISKHIDEIMDYFPINKVTKRMRKDLYDASASDFDKLTNNGANEQDAAMQIVENIETPEVLAKMIPNNHFLWYYAILVIMACVSWYIFEFINQPDFLQVFLPARFEFPQIIKRLIEFIVISFLCYPLVMLFYRFLPQKYLNRSFRSSMTFLYTGTILSSLYFSISMAYVWFTFNGFTDAELTSGLFTKFMFYFYQSIIKPFPMTFIYSCINSLCFLFSAQFYHLEKKPDTYDFNLIYHSNTQELSISEPTILDVPVVSESRFHKVKAFIETKKQAITESKKKPAVQQQALAPETVPAPLPETAVEEVKEEMKPVKKKKRKNKYANIKVANDIKNQARNKAKSKPTQ